MNCKDEEMQPLVQFEVKAHRMEFAQMYLRVQINQFEQFHVLLL
jgi:hypothetical protein